MKKPVLYILANFLAVILLISLIGLPFLFAKNFAQVAGVKSQSPYLVVPQVEKFPGMKLEQVGDQYLISFTKQGSSQAYLSVLILNNPTGSSQTYSLELTTGSTIVFFGQDLDNLLTKIKVPSGTSVPVSLYSLGEASTDSQTVGFKIISD